MAGQVAPKSPRQNKSCADNRLVCTQARKSSNRYLSQFQLPEPSESVPVLELEDIKRGEVLGKGGFGTVYAVKRIESRIVDEDSTENSFNSDKEARYAIKVLNTKALIKDEDLFNTLMDNATEAKLLESLDHPNIIKIRAVPASGMFSEQSFLLLDRLEGTLRERLRGEWKPSGATMQRVKGIVGKILNRVSHGHTREAIFWNQRMHYAADLASAMAYMHAHRVVHRDLKPENIGFDRDNNLKIFDFGLARQLPQPETSDETIFKMTGHCGSPRYMAPEVALNHRYNEKVDVYSFSLLLWEILSLETPFMGVNKQYLKTNVWRGRHVRPKLNETWSPSLQGLLNEAWHRDAAKRPSMTDIRDRLRMEERNGKDLESPSSNARRAWMDRLKVTKPHSGSGIQGETTFAKNTPTPRAA